jgi:serine/threonine protein kinase
MQRCEGGSLFQAAMENRRLFSEGTARHIMTGILAGLVHLHQTCRMVHRDLKAENVLLTETGQPVLADFGLARTMPKTGKLHWRCGTPGYMAPEMLLDGGYDTQVDVYAAGGVLHLMLCGQAPFMNSTVVKTLRATLRGTLDLGVNPHFDNVSPLGKQALTSFLQRDPVVRPTAEEAMSIAWFTEEIANVEAMRTPMFAQVNKEVAHRCVFHYCNDTSSESSASFEEEDAGPRAPVVPTPPRNPRPRSSSAFVRNKVGGLLRRLVPRRIAAFTTMARAPRLPLLSRESFPAVTPVAPAMQPVPPSSAAPKRVCNRHIKTMSKSVSRNQSKPCGDVTAISTGVSLLQGYASGSGSGGWSTTGHAEDHALKDYVAASRNALRGQGQHIGA